MKYSVRECNLKSAFTVQRKTCESPGSSNYQIHRKNTGHLMLNNTTIAKVGQSALWHILINFLWFSTEKVKQWPRLSYRMHDEQVYNAINRQRGSLINCQFLSLRQMHFSHHSKDRYNLSNVPSGRKLFETSINRLKLWKINVGFWLCFVFKTVGLSF